MTTSSKTSMFGEAFKAGLKASEDKAKNLSSIDNVIQRVDSEISEITNNIISIKYKSPTKINPLAVFGAATIGALNSQVFIDQPKDEMPKTKAIYAVNRNGDEELLSVVELSSDGYPCTIYLDGNKLIAFDEISFASNLSELISSSTIGDKFQRLLETVN